jgi:L-iditol 2-dehydrogenase
MQAARLLATDDLQVMQVPDPIAQPGEVLVRVEAAGICGTDRHLLKGEFPCKPPVTLGHEFAGIVVGNGAGAALPLGMRVSCDPNIACGTCESCRRGRVNLCANNVAVGIHRDGGFAEFVAFPAHRAIAVPQELNPMFAAFCEPLACTLHGIDLGAPLAGERVIVLGGGVIGLLAAQLARNAGAEVMLVTRQAGKRDLAVSLGADKAAANLNDALKIWPQGADLVLECAGVGETVAMAPLLARTGGRVVILGVMPKGEKVQIEPFDLLFREVQILHSFINPFTQTRAAEMIAAGRINVGPLISRVIPLSEAVECISHPARPGEVKVIVVPN